MFRQSNWLDAKADCSNEEHRKRLRTLGALLALSVTNACRLPVELPDLFFRWLLLGGESPTAKHKLGQQLSSSCPSFEPSVEDMVALDKSLERPFEALKDAVQSDDALKGLLEIEDLPAETSAADYIAYMVRQTFLEPVQWQMSEVRKAFFRTLPSPPQGQRAGFSSAAGGHFLASVASASAALLHVLPRPPVLAEIIRGKSPILGDRSGSGGGGGDSSLRLPSPSRGSRGAVQQEDKWRHHAKDFDFREEFSVYEDRELVACVPLHEVSRNRRTATGPTTCSPLCRERMICAQSVIFLRIFRNHCRLRCSLNDVRSPNQLEGNPGYILHNLNVSTVSAGVVIGEALVILPMTMT